MARSHHLLAVVTLITGGPASGCMTAADDDVAVMCAHPISTLQRITAVQFPQTQREAGEASFDFDHDGHGENMLGAGYSAFRGLTGDFDPAPQMNERLQSADDFSWWIRVAGCSGSPAITASLEYWDPQRETLILASVTPAVGTAILSAHGASLGLDTLTATGGLVALPLAYLADQTRSMTDPGWTTGTELSISLTRDAATGILRGRLGLILPTAATRLALREPLRAYINASAGAAAFRDALDDDDDGLVSNAELANSPGYEVLVQHDLATVDDTGARVDGTSFAFGIAATAE